MLDYSVRARRNPQTRLTIYTAQLKPVTPLTLSDLAKVISKQCTVTVHDIKAVISALEEQIGLALLNGHSVRFGDLGSFHPRLKCKSVSNKDDFKVSNITGVNIRFTKGAKLRNDFRMTSKKVQFRQVA